MPPILFFVNLYFLAVAFFSPAPGEASANILLSYYGIQINFIANNKILFFLLLLLLLLVYVRINYGRKNKLKKLSLLVKKLFAIIVIGSFASFLLIVAVALLQLNINSLALRVNEKALGVQKSPESIMLNLEESQISPKVLSAQSSPRAVSRAVASSQSGNSSFYGRYVLLSVPDYLVLPDPALESDIVMVGNTLVVYEINSPEFQKVSPVAAYLMIQNQFPLRAISRYPEVSVMSRQEYAEFRVDNFTEQAEAIDRLITRIKQSTEDLDNQIALNQELLQETQTELEEQKRERERQYGVCVNEGYYESGEYVRTNTPVNCRERVGLLDEEIGRLSTSVSEIADEIANSEQLALQQKAYIDFYEIQKSLVQSQTDYVSYEYAVFAPPDKIRITPTVSNNPRPLADYFAVLIHEYLHYTTSNSQSRLSSLFFEEGLTEYFARSIVSKNFDVETNMGYPVNAKIISQMTKRISEADFAEIYFEGDQAVLVSALDRVYGEDFYTGSQIDFETIHYSSSSTQILELSNQIMSTIGGEPLSQSDVFADNETFLVK